MPLYKYVCPNCGHTATLLRKISDADDVKCDVCGAKMTRQIGNIGILFKGSGYYVTDSKGSTKKTSAKEGKTVKSSS